MLADGGLREILVATLVALVGYLAVLALRLARLRKAPPVGVAATSPAKRSPAGDEIARVAAPPPDSPDRARPAIAGAGAAPAGWPPPAKPTPAANPAPPGVSPVHEEAAALARQGLDAGTIARRCGITLSEAELVCWLSRNREPS